MSSLMSPTMHREKKIILCINCLDINPITNNRCVSCNFKLVLKGKNSLLNESSKALFYGYQQRLTMEKFLKEREPDNNISSASHIPFNEIFDFLVTVILYGASYETIRLFLKHLKSKITHKKINIVSPLQTESKYSIDIDLLEKLSENPKELKLFIKYIKEYQDGLKNIHPYIKGETLPYNPKILENNRETLSKLNETLKLLLKTNPKTNLKTKPSFILKNKSELKSKISKGKIKEVLVELIELTKHLDEKNNEFVLLLNQFNNWEKKSLLNLSNDNITPSRITDATLRFIDLLEEDVL